MKPALLAASALFGSILAAVKNSSRALFAKVTLGIELDPSGFSLSSFLESVALAKGAKVTVGARTGGRFWPEKGATIA
jgi:hypothetical protein